jgi:hypothetical protein
MRVLRSIVVTANPTAAWVWRQVIEATPWGTKPRHLLRDQHTVYGRDFRRRAQRMGVDSIATPYSNRDRPHRTLGLQAPELRPRPTTGPIRSRSVLNGLHHVYERAA